MTKTITIRNTDDIEYYIESLRQSSEEAQFNLEDISSHSDPLNFLGRVKYEKVGCDPLDTQRPLNFIEQLDSLALNLGTKSGTDIKSRFANGIAAEVFAAVKHSNNNKPEVSPFFEGFRGG